MREVCFVAQNCLAKAKIQLSVNRKTLAPNQMDDFSSLLKLWKYAASKYFLHGFLVVVGGCMAACAGVAKTLRNVLGEENRGEKEPLKIFEKRSKNEG